VQFLVAVCILGNGGRKAELSLKNTGKVQVLPTSSGGVRHKPKPPEIRGFRWLDFVSNLLMKHGARDWT
jgi:hypothetical protein